MESSLENVNTKILIGHVYVTDVCARFEFDKEAVDAYRVWRRYHENLQKVIPVYADEEVEEFTDEEGDISV